MFHAFFQILNLGYFYLTLQVSAALWNPYNVFNFPTTLFNSYSDIENPDHILTSS